MTTIAKPMAPNGPPPPHIMAMYGIAVPPKSLPPRHVLAKYGMPVPPKILPPRHVLAKYGKPEPKWMVKKMPRCIILAPKPRPIVKSL